MKIMSYVITHDYGFAPNPYGGVLTLATCKPVIRNNAKLGDVLVATGSQKGAYGNKLIYVGKISEIVTMDKYFEDLRFALKKPKGTSGKDCRGDNIYYKKDNEWLQLENRFHGESEMGHDLKSKNVLICKEFWYFGNKAPGIPERFSEIVKYGPGHKNISKQDIISDFLYWLNGFEQGRIGEPSSLIKNRLN